MTAAAGIPLPNPPPLAGEGREGVTVCIIAAEASGDHLGAARCAP